jgi:uncharacterized repeat protein (TIGR01451 family)
VCTVNADQGGDVNYNPAPQMQQSFNISPVESDISVSVSCPTTASAGDMITCTISATNNGPAVSQGTTLTALFSNTLTGASVTSGTILGQTVTWTAPSLASGGSASITFTATASTPSKSSISVSLLQENPDPNISNNIADTKIVIY